MKFKIHYTENDEFVMAEYGDGLVYLNSMSPNKKKDELGPAWMRMSKKIKEFEGSMEDFRKTIIKEHIKKDLLTNETDNLKAIKEELRKWAGKQYFEDPRDGLTLLIGATGTDEDYYWVTIGEDEKLRLYSCVCYPGEFVKKPKVIKKFEKMRQEGTLEKYIDRKLEEYCEDNVDVRIEV